MFSCKFFSKKQNLLLADCPTHLGVETIVAMNIRYAFLTKRDELQTVTGHQSEGSRVRRVTSPKGHGSEGSLVRRVTSPKGHESEGSLVRRVTSPKSHQLKSEGSLVRKKEFFT
jgi:hypothetical protein